ncbi:hypothetical protein TrispH2_011481, partial [Trichoplax sp. H2]
MQHKIGLEIPTTGNRPTKSSLILQNKKALLQMVLVLTVYMLA